MIGKSQELIPGNGFAVRPGQAGSRLAPRRRPIARNVRNNVILKKIFSGHRFCGITRFARRTFRLLLALVDYSLKYYTQQIWILGIRFACGG
jgi:hypothetical protein